MADETDAVQPDQLPVSPGTVKAAVLSAVNRMESTVSDLTAEQWGQASAVPSWTLGDVVTHLTVGMSMYPRLLNAVTSGKGSGGIWQKVGAVAGKVAPAISPALGALNSAIPRALDRGFSMEVLKGHFASNARSLREAVERIQPDDFSRPVHYAGTPWPLSFGLAWILNELAIHHWDIASQLHPDAHLDEEARALLPYFYLSGTRLMFHPPNGRSGTIQLELSDPMTELWWTTGSNGLSQGVGQATQADATVHGECGTAILVLAGRISVEDALRATSLHCEGDQDLVHAFFRAWKSL